jgi:hypothetical protein
MRSLFDVAPLRSLASYALRVAIGGLCLGAACADTPNESLSDDGGGGGSSSGGSSGSSSGSSPGSSSGGSSGGSSSGGGSSGGSSSGSSSGGSSGGSSSGGGPSPEGGVAEAGPGAGDGGLDPGVAPGGNFDLSLWELQEPVGSPGSPTTILPAQLVGPSGYHDTYFFTDPTDGAMSFWDPENGVTTPNSNYPRSELREMTAAGAPASWPVTGTNTLSATLKATLVPSHVAVGQIHIGSGTPASVRPLLELFYFSSGQITLGIEQTPAGGNEVQHNVGSVPLGKKWSYVIGLSGNTISLTIDGGTKQTFAMSSTFNQEGMYFKAGDYDQSAGSSATVGAKVQFYALTIFHGP